MRKPRAPNPATKLSCVMRHVQRRMPARFFLGLGGAASAYVRLGTRESSDGVAEALVWHCETSDRELVGLIEARVASCELESADADSSDDAAVAGTRVARMATKGAGIFCCWAATEKKGPEELFHYLTGRSYKSDNRTAHVLCRDQPRLVGLTGCFARLPLPVLRLSSAAAYYPALLSNLFLFNRVLLSCCHSQL